MAIIKKDTNNDHWQGHGQNGTLLYCWWEDKLVKSLWKTIMGFLKKLELLHDPEIPLQSIFLKNTKTLIQKDICTSMLTAVLFIIAKIWK